MAGSQHIRAFFHNKLALLQDVISTLAGGGMGTSACWWRLCVSLSKINVRLSLDTMRDIELASTTSALLRAEEAWRRICGHNVTVDMLIIALEDASLTRLADAVRVALFGGSPMANMVAYDPLPLPPTMALRLTDMASRKRIGDPLDKLEDDACLVVKVSCVNVTEESKLADLDFEICGAYKCLPAATREANARLDDEIQAAGGDETRVCNMYTVWPFRAYASAARPEVKDRTRDAGQKPPAAAMNK